jgi:hypothetical protein
MKRKLFTWSALFSLLLGAATVWWWTGSSRRIDQISLERGGAQSMRLLGSSGKLMFTKTAMPRSASVCAGQLAWSSVAYNSSDKSSADPKLALASFSYTSQPLADKPGGHESTLVLPAWLLTLIFALMPTLWFGSKMKTKKKPSG